MGLLFMVLNQPPTGSLYDLFQVAEQIEEP